MPELIPVGKRFNKMGLFSGISNALFGTDDAINAQRDAAEQQLGFQREALDYMKGVQAPVLAQRDRSLGVLGDFYNNPQSQQQFISDTMASPFYQQLVDQGETSVLRNAAATGGLRSGGANQALAQNSQNVLMNLTNQRLGGLSSLAGMPINTAGISNVYQNMGNTAAQSGIAQANTRQQGLGQLFGLAGSIFGAT